VVNFSRVLNTLQGTFEKQEYIDGFNNFQLLVIDDLGIERDTAYAKEQVYNIIDSRYRSGLPMIITTNMSMDKIKNPKDIENLRIYDRIVERCHPIEVSGINRRRKAVREEYDTMKNLLGLE
jgi:DNA replication protein DnaC